MSNFDHDFDPSMHTPEEIAAWRASREAYKRWLVEMRDMEDDLDDEQAALEQLADEDYLGLCFFGDNDQWLDRRLKRGTPN